MNFLFFSPIASWNLSGFFVRPGPETPICPTGPFPCRVGFMWIICFKIWRLLQTIKIHVDGILSQYYPSLKTDGEPTHTSNADSTNVWLLAAPVNFSRWTEFVRCNSICKYCLECRIIFILYLMAYWGRKSFFVITRVQLPLDSSGVSRIFHYRDVSSVQYWWDNLL